MTAHVLPRTTYVYHAASGDADCRFSKYYLHCRFLGKDFGFFVASTYCAAQFETNRVAFEQTVNIVSVCLKLLGGF